MKKILFIGLFLVCISPLSAEEENYGFIVRDREPRSMHWSQDADGYWTLVARFEKVTLTTYFKKGPIAHKFELGLNPGNIPYRQIIEFRHTGKTCESKKCEYIHAENGEKLCAFTYHEKISISGGKFNKIFGEIYERPQNLVTKDLPKNEVRYELWGLPEQNS
jgi:hypothetical protein